MANGGKRPGAGRRKGSKNKRTQEVQAAVNAGIDPLGYMLGVMRDPAQPQDRRDEMAKAAAPYCHGKLATIEHTGKDGGPIEHTVRVEFVDPTHR